MVGQSGGQKLRRRQKPRVLTFSSVQGRWERRKSWDAGTGLVARRASTKLKGREREEGERERAGETQQAEVQGEVMEYSVLGSEKEWPGRRNDKATTRMSTSASDGGTMRVGRRGK